MLRVKVGDAFAYEQLMQRYHHRLVRFLMHVGGPDDSGEDLAQEVFLRVWRARENYQPNARFATWLFHIAHNIASNAIRDRQRRRETQVIGVSNSQSSILTLDQLAMASTGMMPVRRLDKAERSEMVKTAVEALNERQRMALVLCAFEHMSYQEIADTMELTVKAVKSLLSRARVNLKELLDPYINDEQAAKSDPPAG
jgi:RNA polymerase sigma-70 factor, ECF subfamily